MPTAGPAQQDTGAALPHSAPLTLSKKIFGLALALALLALVVVAFRDSSADLASHLASANPWLVALGFLLNILAFGARAYRLNLLLPPTDRIPVATGWSLSGATTSVSYT